VDSPAIDTFRLQLTHLARLVELRRELEGQAHRLLKDRPDDQCLCSLPGVASVLAMVILAEGGDLRRFRHHRQFLKYCGLDLAKSQSGQFRGRDKYERYMKQDPGNADVRRKALTAVAAKLARVAYVLVKRLEPYRIYHEHALPSGSIAVFRTGKAVAARARTLCSLWSAGSPFTAEARCERSCSSRLGVSATLRVARGLSVTSLAVSPAFRSTGAASGNAAAADRYIDVDREARRVKSSKTVRLRKRRSSSRTSRTTLSDPAFIDTGRLLSGTGSRA
jgi:transposase IS116/IS110/IS902 family protein